MRAGTSPSRRGSQQQQADMGSALPQASQEQVCLPFSPLGGYLLSSISTAAARKLPGKTVEVKRERDCLLTPSPGRASQLQHKKSTTNALTFSPMVSMTQGPQKCTGHSECLQGLFCCLEDKGTSQMDQRWNPNSDLRFSNRWTREG